MARKAAYALWALLNAAAVVGLVVAYEPFEGWAFVLAAGIQGLPMLLDLPLWARTTEGAHAREMTHSPA